MRAGATVGLISHGGIQGILLAGNELLAASVAEDPQLRRSAAALVGEIGNPAFYHPLLRLLADRETSVVLAALQAAARLRSRELWPAVLPALDRASLRGYAIDALRGGGTAAAKAISARIGASDVSLAQQSRLVRTLGVIDDAMLAMSAGMMERECASKDDCPGAEGGRESAEPRVLTQIEARRRRDWRRCNCWLAASRAICQSSRRCENNWRRRADDCCCCCS